MKQQDVIILHGWNLSGSWFEPLARILRHKGYRVFAPDLPGFGNEPSPKEPWHVSDYADFLKGFLEKHDVHTPILIAHSFGGRVALQFAMMYPDVAKKLVITGTPGYSPVPQKKMNFFLMLAKIGGVLFLLPGLHLLADFARKVLYRLAGAREFYRAEGEMRQTFKNVVTDDLVTAMRSVRVPCLLVWGETDTIVPVAVAQKMSETIPNSKLVIIPAIGHDVPFKQSKLFASHLWNFLS